MYFSNAVATRDPDSPETITLDATGLQPRPTLDLAVVLPTFNERENIPPILDRLRIALAGLSWEAIFVDDDSPDGTSEVVAEHAAVCLEQSPRVRLIHRIGRRGLASACIEGMMSTTAPFVAVMDADLQHDESILPVMLNRLRQESLDLVVGSRNAEGGSMGEFGTVRVLLSRLGRKISQTICCKHLSDPMSGFFIVRRSFFLEVVRDLQGSGFKILVDMLASSPHPVRLAEVGYTFRLRQHGESKLDLVVGIEYLILVLNKRLGAGIPAPLALYLLVGLIGLATHLLVLFVLTQVFRLDFVTSQIAATFAAMIENFVLNNLITFRDRRFRGLGILGGGARFVAACSFGAWANVIFARSLLQSGTEWYLAGLAGILLGSVWNLSLSSACTWHARRRVPAAPLSPAFAADLEVSQ